MCLYMCRYVQTPLYVPLCVRLYVRLYVPLYAETLICGHLELKEVVEEGFAALIHELDQLLLLLRVL